MQGHHADLIVVGTGLAGLACALNARGRVLLLTKTRLAESGSSYQAKGGIAAAIGTGDDPSRHAEDTVQVAAGLGDAAVIADLTKDAPTAIAELVAHGAPFDRAPGGGIALGREAAHAAARIVQAGGDATGRHVCDALLRAVRAAPHVSLLEGCFAFRLLTARGHVCGVLAYDDEAGWMVLRSGRVVLATGGIGALWAETTNPPEATGDGLAMAAWAGAELADLEFVQFHPTALDLGAGAVGLPLLSEALRGAGATLVDGTGRRFMAEEHAEAELGPRDVVARAVHRVRSRGGQALLDLRPALAQQGEAAFPEAIKACRAAGFEPTRAPVPIAPAAHYYMGGVKADASGRTSLPGLWACGEVACTGMHGASRLASNSLLEAYLLGKRAAADMAGWAPLPCAADPGLAVPSLPEPAALRPLTLRLRALASRHLGVERDREGLESALSGIADIERCTSRLPDSRLGGSGWIEAVRAYGELRNLRLVARLVACAALARTESRGAHYRRDHPFTLDAWRYRQTTSLAGFTSLERPSRERPALVAAE